MPGGYDMQDLLNLISNEGAERLVLRVGKPPVVCLHGEENVVEGPTVTQDNDKELFHSLETPEQIRELDSLAATFTSSTLPLRQKSLGSQHMSSMKTLAWR